MQKALNDSTFKGLRMGTYSVLIKFQIDIDGSIKNKQAYFGPFLITSKLFINSIGELLITKVMACVM